jgi:hypothetical protein
LCADAQRALFEQVSTLIKELGKTAARMASVPLVA